MSDTDFDDVHVGNITLWRIRDLDFKGLIIFSYHMNINFIWIRRQCNQRVKNIYGLAGYQIETRKYFDFIPLTLQIFSVNVILAFCLSRVQTVAYVGSVNI